MNPERFALQAAIRERHKTRSMAVVSGKGGSGKTMITALMARIAAEDMAVVLIDADTGTAGLTYYLGLHMVKNTAVGLADIVVRDLPLNPLPLQRIGFPGLSAYRAEHVEFLCVGHHRRLFDGATRDRVKIAMGDIMTVLGERSETLVIVDCRGGIDEDSIAVCELVDDIVLIVEPDTTSFQATQHLVEVIASRNLAHKLSGFIVNKVFDDPSGMIQSAISQFHCPFLAAVPFDVDATRAFLVGRIADLKSQFAIQLWYGLHRVAHGSPLPALALPRQREWKNDEFSQVSLLNPDSVRGGLAISAFLLALGCVIALKLSVDFLEGGRQALVSEAKLPYYTQVALLIFVLGLCGTLEPTRRFVGRIVGNYVKVFTRVVSGKKAID